MTSPTTSPTTIASPDDRDAPLLSIDQVSVSYPARGWRSKPHQVLHEVSLDIRPGETLGLVGESGSGKSTLGRAVLGLVPVQTGAVQFDGRVISTLSRRERRTLGSQIQVVFQDPYSSLNPAMTILDSLSEPLMAAGRRGREAHRRVRQVLDDVRLPGDVVERLPREMSGGQRQRVAIARALCLDPRLVVCDEPVSALDMSTRSAVLDILVDVQDRRGVAFLFISHDLAVVRQVSHRVAVMAGGRIVESGDTAPVTESPGHPYTRQLLLAAPVPDPVLQQARREKRLRIRHSSTEGDPQR